MSRFPRRSDSSVQTLEDTALDAAIAAAVGLSQFPTFVDPNDLPLSSFGAGALGVANAAYMVRFRVKKAITVSKIEFYVITPAGSPGTLDGAIHSTDLTTWTKLASVTTPPTLVDALNSLTLSTAVTLVPGVDYAAGPSCSETTTTFARAAVTESALGGLDSMVIVKGVQHPFGASFTAPLAGTIIPWMRLRV